MCEINIRLCSRDSMSFRLFTNDEKYCKFSNNYATTASKHKTHCILRVFLNKFHKVDEIMFSNVNEHFPTHLYIHNSLLLSFQQAKFKSS